MLFNSYVFLFGFLPISVCVYFLLLRGGLATASKGWLVLASLFFYGWSNVVYLPLIVGTMTVNFVVGMLIRKGRTKARRQATLTVGIVANVLLLGYYKYCDFFISTVNDLLATNWTLLYVVLPLGISFFTFQQIGYLVDVYRRDAADYSFLDYALFVTFFPQLIVGPIVQHNEIMPQFAKKEKRKLDEKNVVLGMFFLVIGLFKKVAIADSFSQIVHNGYDLSQSLTLIEAWLTTHAYTLQLYFDFSGYTDMAVGAALLFNIRLPVNFNSPYQAKNITDLWQRWHITLGRFLSKYIYLPLGADHGSESKTRRNLLIVFLVSGLWHGASWLFVFWGFLHAVAMIVHRAWERAGFRLPTWLAMFVTFEFSNLTLVFFRSADWSTAFKVLAGMAGLNGLGIGNGYPITQTLLQVGLLVLVVWFAPNSRQISKRLPFNRLTALVLAGIFVCGVLQLDQVSEFLYFQF